VWGGPSKGENGRENSRIFCSCFPYFSIIFILFEKYDKRYGNEIGYCRIDRNMVVLPFISYLAENPVIFQINPEFS
jgi:hypothetical protein